MEAYAPARGHEAPFTINELAPELCELSRGELTMFSQQVMRMARRHAWRTRMAWRSASLSRILRHASRGLGEKYAGRQKVEGNWLVRALVDGHVIDVMRVVLPPVRRLEDFLVPLEVTLLREDVMAKADLEMLLVLPAAATTRSGRL